MAYVLGYFYADGSLEDASYLRGRYIRVSSVEKDTILKIRHWLGSEHTIVECAPTTKNGGTRYLLRIGSHALYAVLVKLGLYPNKSLTVRFPNTLIPKRFLGDFIRGYFDGDGCVYLRKGNKGNIKGIRVIFVSGSRAFLDGLVFCLRQRLNLQQRKVYRGHRSFQLMYSTNDSLKIFAFMYRHVHPSVLLERKFTIFKKYLMMRPGWVDTTIARVLRSWRLATW